MSQVRVTAESKDSILKGARLMLRENAFVLPVSDADQIVGVARMGDLFQGIMNVMLKL